MTASGLSQSENTRLITYQTSSQTIQQILLFLQNILKFLQVKYVKNAKKPVFPVHTTKVCKGSRGTPPFIPKLRTTWK
jgi:hypothetical protein